MENQFCFKTKIQSIRSIERNTLECVVFPVDPESISQEVKTDIEKFLQQLFQLIVKKHEDDFNVIGEDDIRYDDLEQAVLNGEIKLSYIGTLYKDNVAVAFLEDDINSWTPSNMFIDDSVKDCFIAHVQCLQVLEKVLENTEDGKKKEIFEGVCYELRAKCADYMKRNHQSVQALCKAFKEMRENDDDFQTSIEEIKKKYI